MIGPDGDKFVWGRIVDIHRIGDYHIVEYKEKLRTPTTGDPKGKYAEASSFHPYVTLGALNPKTVDCCERYPSLDTAILGAMAYKMGGPNTQAALFACRVLGFKVESDNDF